MSVPTCEESCELPSRLLFDPESHTLTVIVDASPAAIKDCTVSLGRSRLEVAVEHPEGTFERRIEPPTARRSFTGEASATHNNGVLSVRVDTCEEPTT